MTCKTTITAGVLAAITLSLALQPASGQGILGRGEPTTLAAHADAMARVAVCDIEMSDRGIAEVALGLERLSAAAGLDAASADAVMATVLVDMEAAGIDCDRNHPEMVPAYEAVVFYEDRARRADNRSLLMDSLSAILTVVATIEYCQIQVEGDVAARMGSHAIVLETNLGMTDEESAIIYAGRLEELRAATLDCSEGGVVRTNIEKAVRFFGG